MKSVLADRLFHLKENGTTVRRECFAGLTTFVTMAYILAVNPAILGAAGMDRGAVFTASALAACAATLLMALLSNYPFALAPGMGLNAYFAYTVVIKQGYSWQMALAAVFLEALLFIVLSVASVREAIFNSIPRPLKLGVTWGIGLFILFIGLQNSKLIVADPSPCCRSTPSGRPSPPGRYVPWAWGRCWPSPESSSPPSSLSAG